jgi:DNA-binding winged helix-turn-helix (wHTH) protein
MSPEESEPRVARFEPFTLDLGSGELREDGRTVKRHAQPAQLLVILVSRAGEIVTREEIQEALWEDDTHVDFDLGINSCIRQIRTALGDDADEPHYLETIPRRGYRFIAPVREPVIEEKPQEPEPPKRQRSKIWVGALAALAALAGVVWTLSRSEPEVKLLKSIPLTSYEGIERDPTFSPDGDQVAFVWDQGARRRAGR